MSRSEARMRKGTAAVLAVMLLAAGCSVDPASPPASDATSSAGGSVTSAAVTTVPGPNPAGLPGAASVERLAWRGTVRALQFEGGVRSELTGTVEGAFVAPGLHRVHLTATSTGPEEGDVEEADWTATIVGRTGWVLEDGELRAFAAEPVVDEYMTVLSTASGTVLPSPVLLAELARLDEVVIETRSGRTVARYEIADASLGLYTPVFSSDFGLAFGSEGLTADVSLVVDVATGVIVEGRLDVSSDVAGRVLDVEIAFEVTALDDPSVEIALPDVVVPSAATLVPFSDDRFTTDYPDGWNVGPFEGGVVFRPPYTDDDLVITVLVDATVASTGEFVESILAQAPSGAEIERRESVVAGDAEYERIVVRFAGESRAVAWVTTIRGTGYALEASARSDLFDEFEALAEAIFATFRPAG